jgi:hypothetical protein
MEDQPATPRQKPDEIAEIFSTLKRKSDYEENRQ